MDTEIQNALHKGIDSNGKVYDQGALTLALLGSTGPATANEVMAFAKQTYPTLTHAQIESINKRFSELSDRGAVKKRVTNYNVIFVRRCKVTGKMCCVWEVTGNDPSALTTKERLQKAIAKAEARLSVLKSKFANL